MLLHQLHKHATDGVTLDQTATVYWKEAGFFLNNIFNKEGKQFMVLSVVHNVRNCLPACLPAFRIET